MELNRLVFPRPASSYTHETMKGKIIYVPKYEIVENIATPFTERLNNKIS
jgi:hypothetical protein